MSRSAYRPKRSGRSNEQDIRDRARLEAKERRVANLRALDAIAQDMAERRAMNDLMERQRYEGRLVAAVVNEYGLHLSYSR